MGAGERLRHVKAPVAFVTLVTFFVATTIGLVPAHADGGEKPVEPTPVIVSTTVRDRLELDPALREALVTSAGDKTATPVTKSYETNSAFASELAAEFAAALKPESLTLGGDKSGVSSQAITTPSGSGKVQGWGESFSAQLSTGVATFSVPLTLPDARGGIDPSLGLSYSSSGAHGIAGVGWEIGVPFIARQTDRGGPTYNDPSPGTAWLPGQDRFVFNGGQELVPICLVSSSRTCAGAASETMPSWGAGWWYFRARVEGSFLRFFWSSDHKTWRVQDKTGGVLELGHPTVGPIEDSALESDPKDPSRIFRWNISRQYDQHTFGSTTGGTPANLLVYEYLHDGGAAYIQDIYDTPPATGAVTTLAAYAHHTRLDYESRTDQTSSYRRTYRTDYRLRLATVTVTSMAFEPGPARELVRRYKLAYDPTYHVSLLQSVTLEGRCAAAVAENASGDVSPDPGCPTLPAMTFTYAHVDGHAIDGSPATADLIGYEPIDERLHAMHASPDHSVDEDVTDLFDVNADGLPDVLVTSPGLYGGNFGVFYNGVDGNTGSFLPSVMGVCGEGPSILMLNNDNVQTGDLDSDGIVNLIHMPMVQNYWLYTPTPRAGAGCAAASAVSSLPTLPKGMTEYDWGARQISTAASLSPKIDFGTDGDRIRLADVNADGLVDVVRTNGTEIETFFSLGRYPGGDGQFGHATWTSATTATLSNQPVAYCLPLAGTAAAFDDPLIRLADMNGDGIVDLVRLYDGTITYWPGNGNGYWGTGSASSCPAGTTQADATVIMANSPHFADPNATGVRLDDVNGDGLDDLVQVGFSTVSIWLNVDGTGFTPNRHVISGTPAEPAFNNRVRLVDINGSGTRDILWADGLAYQYIDLTGGTQPWLLTGIANGLGKSTQIDYSTSTELLQASRASGTPWTSWTPNTMHVVVRETEDDHLDKAGRPHGVYVTEYQYKNPVYDGVQKEYRGFSWASARRIGDANSPTSSTSTTFLLGQCGDEELTDSLPSPCSFPGRWRDNPREALKGLPVRSDTYDDVGAYQHTVHHQYKLRTLVAGLDGRRVVHAFEEQSDDFYFDNSPFAPAPGTLSGPLADVVIDGAIPVALGIPTLPTVGNPLTVGAKPVSLPAAGTQITHQFAVDPFGNELSTRDLGCPSCGDTPIKNYSDPSNTPADPTGWQWRTVHSYTVGDDGVSKRHERYNQYNAVGDLIGTQAVLSGSIALGRSNPSNPSSARPTPATASLGGLVQTTTITVDSFGQDTFTSRPFGRCRQVDYDAIYAQVPIRETVFVGTSSPDPKKGPCGTTPLQAEADYDRGFQVVTKTRGLHGEPSAVSYDGFGRIVSITRPSGEVPGVLSAQPSVTIEYRLTTNPEGQPYSVVRSTTHDGASESDASYREAWAYADGMGRAIVTLEQADPSQGDAAPWIAKGLTEYDAKGAARRAYRAWWYSGDPALFPLESAATAKYGEQQYDAFGRIVVSYNLDGQVSMIRRYHALSADAWDAEDLGPGPHEGTYATSAKDGHGRDVAKVERVWAGEGVLEEHWTHSVYLTSGEIVAIVRNQSANVRDPSSPRVVRFSTYDSLGRVVMNVDPSASSGVPWSAAGDPLGVTTVPASYKAWRYAYDDAGDLVGTSDARGCGVDFGYDAGGRLTSETYSPCTADHIPNSSASPDVEYVYDTGAVHFDPAADASWPCDDSLNLGRLAAIRDRASRIRTCYDGRGRVTHVQKQLVRGDVAYATGDSDYANASPILSTVFDAADRPVRETSPSIDSSGAVPTSVDIGYSKRGAVVSLRSAEYGPLVSSVVHDADGLLQRIVYADAATTSTDIHYDDRLRIQHVLTSRGPPAIWSGATGYSPAPTPSGAPTSFQLILQDAVLSYDSVDNPTEIRDNRIDEEWPEGAKPAQRTVQYDDLYRVANVAYERSMVREAYQDPYADGTSSARKSPVRPRQSIGARVTSESSSFDWLGNTIATDDDQHAFLDRSLGTVTSGGGTASPYQLSSAGHNVSGSNLNGALWATYDAAGNLSDWAVARDCGATSANCSIQYHYVWDEVGRLASAQRWDLSKSGVPATPSRAPSGAPAYSESYLYDAGDTRIVTRSSGGSGTRSDLYYFPSFEERQVEFNAASATYTCPTSDCPRAYLMAHGIRIAHLDVEPTANGLPTTSLSVPTIHVLLELDDYLGSTNAVIDRDTGELVEWASYSTMGGAEGEYRSPRWNGWREVYGFTGKQESRQLGITYFGARWLVPELGRWASADPAAVHAGGADLNAYAYVRGEALRSADPVGLESVPLCSSLCPGLSPFSSSGSGPPRFIDPSYVPPAPKPLTPREQYLWGQAGGTLVAWTPGGVLAIPLLISRCEGNRDCLAGAEHALSEASATQTYLAMGEMSAARVSATAGAACEVGTMGACTPAAAAAATAATVLTAAAATHLAQARANAAGAIAVMAVAHSASPTPTPSPAAPKAGGTTAAPKRPPPASDNYRGRYQASLAGKGKARLPEDWDAHHRIPQEYRDNPQFKDFDFDAPENIQGVPGSRSGTNVHQDITNDWAAFRKANPDASRSQVEAFAQGIDKKYGSKFWTGDKAK
ncbi:MAG: toxin TcdB middle/N-terminal domain-containing protein [Polyangiales bacterium]